MVGNKNSRLGRNPLVGFETCGERGTIVTNGNQSASGGETVNVCTAEDIAERAGQARTYEFQREYAASNIIKRIFVELPRRNWVGRLNGKTRIWRWNSKNATSP